MARTEPLRLTTQDGVALDGCHLPAARNGTRLGIVLAYGFSGSWRGRHQRRIAAVLAGRWHAVVVNAAGAAVHTHRFHRGRGRRVDGSAALTPPIRLDGSHRVTLDQDSNMCSTKRPRSAGGGEVSTWR